jgi:hypothetical protein
MAGLAQRRVADVEANRITPALKNVNAEPVLVDRFGHKAGLEFRLHLSQRGLNGGKAMHAVQHLLLQIGDGTWQDVMLSAGNIFFCITFIPMLRHPERPPLLTCIPTGLALVAGGFVFATLHLWLTALTQTITGLQWLALVFKRSPKNASSLTDIAAPRDSRVRDCKEVAGLSPTAGGMADSPILNR